MSPSINNILPQWLRRMWRKLKISNSFVCMVVSSMWASRLSDSSRMIMSYFAWNLSFLWNTCIKLSS